MTNKQQTPAKGKPINVLISMIAIFAIVTSVFIYDWLHPDHQYPEARAGLLDAREWDFARQGIIPLRGEWEFYENRLLTPQDFQSDPSLHAESRIVRVPGNLEGALSSGNGYGAGTYRLQMLVSDPDSYSLRGKKIRLSSHIYMDGTDVGGTGHPDVTEEGFVPSNLPFIGTVQAQSDTIEIMIQVASYRYLKGGLVQTPEFGRTSDVLASRDHARLADMIVITTMLVFAVYILPACSASGAETPT